MDGKQWDMKFILSKNLIQNFLSTKKKQISTDQ